MERSEDEDEVSNGEHREEGGEGHEDTKDEHLDDNGGFQNIDSFRRLKAKLNVQFKIPLNKIVSSVGEILTNALALAKETQLESYRSRRSDEVHQCYFEC